MRTHHSLIKYTVAQNPCFFLPDFFFADRVFLMLALKVLSDIETVSWS